MYPPRRPILARLIRALTSYILPMLVLLPFLALAQVTATDPPVVPAQSAFGAAFWTVIFPTLSTVVGAACVWALTKLGAFINEKTAALKVEAVTNKDRVIASKFAASGERLYAIVLSVVADANVSLRPQFTEFMKDGVFSPDEAKQMKELVMNLLKAKLAPDFLAYLRNELGGLFDNVLGGMIERAVVATRETVPSFPSLNAAKEETAANPQ